MESSLVSGVGAIATSSSAANGPGIGPDASRNERLPAVGKHDHVTRLDVRRGVLEEAELVAGRVVEAVGRHVPSLAGLPPRGRDHIVTKREGGSAALPTAIRPGALGRRRPAEDVGVAERRRAGGLGRRRRDVVRRRRCLDPGAPGVDRRAVCRIAGVLPDGRGVRVAGDRVHVVAQELDHEVVLARAARVTRRAAMHLGERADDAARRDRRVRDYADESAGVVVVGRNGVVNAL